jgi:hypothetical protein
MWGGWTVHVTDAVGVQIYYAYISDRADAVAAVRHHIGATSEQTLEARKPVQSTVFDAIGIGAGTIRYLSE